MYASKPTKNKTNTTFFIFLAFSREGSKSRRAEQATNPTSVTKTIGTNQKPTSLSIHVTGVKATAKM
jgi:hypothetical protein